LEALLYSAWLSHSFWLYSFFDFSPVILADLRHCYIYKYFFFYILIFSYQDIEEDKGEMKDEPSTEEQRDCGGFESVK
jgi:hypothetical protein